MKTRMNTMVCRFVTITAALALLPASVLAVNATGGNATNDIGLYRIHTFKTDGTFQVSTGGVVDVLVVAGGGGGGRLGGGGGGGGVVYSNAYPVSAAGYTVTIGPGGTGSTARAAKGGNGSNSWFGAIMATGGGGGGSRNSQPGNAGGSGGGAGYQSSSPGAASPAGQGNSGGASASTDVGCGGGGGAGAGATGGTGVGAAGGAGGAGASRDISGTTTNYAGGGGGGGSTAGAGGAGGGGAGANGTNNATAGAPNTGGGGGGTRDTGMTTANGYGGNGGSGIVIVRYLLNPDVETRSLSYSTNSFREWYADNGTIDNDSPLVISLANGEFAGTNGQDFAVGGWTTVSNLPANLTAGITRTSPTALAVVLNGAAANHASSVNVTNLTFVFTNNAAFTAGSAATISNNVKADLQIQFRDAPVDPVLTWTTAAFVEAAANDGTLAATSVTVTVANDHFAGTNGQNLAVGGWVTAANLPAGQTTVVTRVSDGQATLTLAGQKNPPHNVADYVSSLAFTFTSNALFSARDSAIITNGTSPAMSISFRDPVLTYAPTAFTEALFPNDGSIGNTLTLTLAGDTLTGSDNDDLVTAGRVVASNVPPGLTAVIRRGSATTLTAALTGRATTNEAADSIANLAFVFQNSAFANTLAGVVTNYAKTNLTVTFVDYARTYYVTTNGSDAAAGTDWTTALATITNAHAKCRAGNGDIIWLGTGAFTQPSNNISKSIMILGSGMTNTIVQGAETRSNAPWRVFTVTAAGLDVIIRDMTVRHGYAAGKNSTTDDQGGAFSSNLAGNNRFINCLLTGNDTRANVSYPYGGAIRVNNSGLTLSVSNCSFVGNCANIPNQDGGGGAISIMNAALARIDNSSFIGNSAPGGQGVGGAIRAGTGAEIRNSTFFGNSCGAHGAAIGSDAQATYCYNVTIVSNSAGGNGGGIRCRPDATVMVYNSIVAGNSSGSGGNELHYTTPAGVGVLIATNSLVLGSCSGAITNGCLTGQDPKASPPADNGGPTPTCAIAVDSPCCGAANPANALATDQRGFARDSQPDLGAYEYGAHAPTPAGTMLMIF